MLENLFLFEISKAPLFYAIVVFTVIVSIVLHELAHGWTAIKLGDDTPKYLHRMTLDPMVHMGPWGLFALFVFGISWGMMPIDPTRLKGKYAEAIVSFAGPLVNLILAALALTTLGLWVGSMDKFDALYAISNLHTEGQPLDGEEPVWCNLRFGLLIFGAYNLVLFLFNMVPAPPLDGSHILANFNRKYANFIYEPQNHGVCMMMFIVAFGVVSAVVGRLFTLALEYVVLFVERPQGFPEGLF